MQNNTLYLAHNPCTYTTHVQSPTRDYNQELKAPARKNMDKSKRRKEDRQTKTGVGKVVQRKKIKKKVN